MSSCSPKGTANERFGSLNPFAEPPWYNAINSPYYTASHRRLRAFIRSYVDEYIIPNCEEWETQGFIPKEANERHVKMGFVAAGIFPLPVEYMSDIKLPADIPAHEWDTFHDLIVIDELARCGYLGVNWGLSCGNAIGCPPIINYGTPAQKKKFLPPILRGEKRMCLAITEPTAGSDVAGLQTTAKKSPDGKYYIVNGQKKWITNGIWADYCTAAVRTGGPGANGISALIIPLKNHPGVTTRKQQNSGVNASGSTFIEFDDVKVPIENLLGKENAGFKIVMSNFNHERLWLGVTALRMARVCCEDAYSHAISRKTFGQPLLSNQVIRAKFTDMGRAIETTHALIENLIYHSTTVSPAQRELDLATWYALVKVQAGRTLEKVNRQAQQILGGLGYSRGGRGGRIEQISRDLRVLVVGGGSDEILTDLVARQMDARAKRAMEKSRL